MTLNWNQNEAECETYDINCQKRYQKRKGRPIDFLEQNFATTQYTETFCQIFYCWKNWADNLDVGEKLPGNKHRKAQQNWAENNFSVGVKTPFLRRK